MSSSNMKTVSLYGGALQMSLPLYTAPNNDLPSVMYNFTDTSMFRQVPDYQEVYNDLNTGVCVITELLDMDPNVCDEEAGAHYFANLALANGCVNIQRAYGQLPSDPSLPFDAIISSPPVYLSDEQCPHFPLGERSTDTGAAVVASKSVTEGMQLIAKYHRVKDATGQPRQDRNEVYIGMAVIRLSPPVATDILVSVSAPMYIAEGSTEQGVVTRPLTAQEARVVLDVAVKTIEVKRWSLFL